MKGGIKMNKNRLIAGIITLLTILSIYQLYNSEYNIRNKDSEIERAIMEFTTPFENSPGVENPVVISKKEVEENLLVFYSDKNIEELLGFTYLKKGVNGKYQIRSTNYGPSNIDIEAYSFETSKNNYIAVGGKEYSKNISSYKLFKWKDELIAEDEVYGNTFLKIYEVSEEVFPVIKVFNDTGTDITRELWNNFENIPSGGVGKAELFMLNVYIIIILIIGFVISKYFWKKDMSNV